MAVSCKNREGGACWGRGGGRCALMEDGHAWMDLGKVGGQKPKHAAHLRASGKAAQCSLWRSSSSHW